MYELLLDYVYNQISREITMQIQLSYLPSDNTLHYSIQNMQQTRYACRTIRDRTI